MDIEKILQAKNKMELKISKINTLLQNREDIKQTILDIRFLKQNAGCMIYTGQSGKMYEPEFLRTIKINDLAGCVAIPELLLKLADKKLEETELELSILTCHS